MEKQSTNLSDKRKSLFEGTIAAFEKQYKDLLESLKKSIAQSERRKYELDLNIKTNTKQLSNSTAEIKQLAAADQKIKKDLAAQLDELKIDFEVQCKAPFNFVDSVELIYLNQEDKTHKSFTVPISITKVQKKGFYIIKGSFRMTPNLIKNWDVRLSLTQDYERMSKVNKGHNIAGSWSFIVSEYIDPKYIPKSKKKEIIPEETLALLE